MIIIRLAATAVLALGLVGTAPAPTTASLASLTVSGSSSAGIN